MVSFLKLKLILLSPFYVQGVSLNTFDLKGTLYPIIYGGDAPNTIAGFDRHTSR